MATTANDAPLGIKLICVLAALGTILGLFGGLGMMGLAGSSGVPGWFGILGIVTVLLSLLNVPMIYGLWTVQPWGWTLAMVLYGLNVIINGISLLAGDAGSILSIVVALIILGYIWSKADVYGKRLGGGGSPRGRRGGPR
jgi:hypothetical protein